MIFIDTPPLWSDNGKCFGRRLTLLIPIHPPIMLWRGLDDLLETIEKVKARPNPNLRVLGWS